MIRLVALKRACWVWWHRACYLELVYLVTAFVPSNMACLVSSPGRSSLDHPGGDAGLGIGGDLLRHLVDVDSFLFFFLTFCPAFLPCFSGADSTSGAVTSCLASSPGRSSLDLPQGDGAPLFVVGKPAADSTSGRFHISHPGIQASRHPGIQTSSLAGVLNSTDEIVNRSALFIPEPPPELASYWLA